MFVFQRASRLHPADPGKATVSMRRMEEGRSAGLRVRPCTRSVRPGQFRSGVPGLSEGERQQTRAKQHQAGCGYCEESFGYEIAVTHGAPADRDAGPNLLKLSESFLLQHRSRTIALISVSKKNAGADEAEKRCNHLDHRNCPCAPGEQKRRAGPHSQKDFEPPPKIAIRLMISSNTDVPQGVAGCYLG